MAANYVLIERITVGAAGASSVTFNSIPQTGYTDLVVKASPRSNRSDSVKDTIDLKFNGTSTGLSERYLQGNGSGTSSGSLANYYGEINASPSTANTFSNLEFYIPNYTSANYKSFSIDTVMEDNATLAIAELFAGLWSNTAAITSITLSVVNGTAFLANSTFYLYGVAKLGTTPAIQPYATGGDTIMTDGTYWYHAFKSSGTFTPAKGLSCDVLVVAGGGGGGGYWGGGGGAGGLLAATSVSVGSATSVTVGAGGAGGVGDYGTAGSNSVFLSTTATGGGYGGYGRSGGSGGSGGGGGYLYGGGTGTSGQGNNGGGGSTFAYTTGGGGGAGAVGGNNSSLTSGSGGIGVNTYSSWASVTGTGVSGYFAGGGGGGGRTVNTNISGSGGSGGGGAGGASGGSTGVSNGTAGTANTGGGGGGSLSDGTNGINGGAGGSGIVIVRYAV